MSDDHRPRDSAVVENGIDDAVAGERHEQCWEGKWKKHRANVRAVGAAINAASRFASIEWMAGNWCRL
jgi:hypothetical protein